jgi:Zn-dependent oligopeptidase
MERRRMLSRHSLRTTSGAYGAIQVTLLAEDPIAAWRAGKSRLDALNRTLQATYKPDVFLDRLDALLMDLKNSRTIAEHLRAQHADPAWRAAAAQVAEEAKKYEAFILGSRSLNTRLVSIHNQLLKKLSALHDSGNEVR